MCSILESDGHCLREKQHHNAIFIPLEIRKQQAVVFGVHVGTANRKISEICGQSNINIDEKQTSSPHHGVWGDP